MGSPFKRKPDGKKKQVITVRIDPATHDKLKEMAWQNKMSLNDFVVTELCRVAAEQLAG